MNQRIDFIIPECYIDTNLVETLVCTGGCNFILNLWKQITNDYIIKPDLDVVVSALYADLLSYSSVLLTVISSYL